MSHADFFVQNPVRILKETRWWVDSDGNSHEESSEGTSEEQVQTVPIQKRSLPDRLAYFAIKLDEIAEDGITADVRPIAFALRMLAEELEQVSHE